MTFHVFHPRLHVKMDDQWIWVKIIPSTQWLISDHKERTIDKEVGSKVWQKVGQRLEVNKSKHILS